MKLEQEISNKDQEAYTKALFELVTKLQIENQHLKEKLEHAEDLLKNMEIPTLTNPLTLGNLKFTGIEVGLYPKSKTIE